MDLSVSIHFYYDVSRVSPTPVIGTTENDLKKCIILLEIPKSFLHFHLCPYGWNAKPVTVWRAGLPTSLSCGQLGRIFEALAARFGHLAGKFDQKLDFRPNFKHFCWFLAENRHIFAWHGFLAEFGRKIRNFWPKMGKNCWQPWWQVVAQSPSHHSWRLWLIIYRYCRCRFDQ